MGSDFEFTWHACQSQLTISEMEAIAFYIAEHT